MMTNNPEPKSFVSFHVIISLPYIETDPNFLDPKSDWFICTPIANINENVRPMAVVLVWVSNSISGLHSNTMTDSSGRD